VPRHPADVVKVVTPGDAGRPAGLDNGSMAGSSGGPVAFLRQAEPRSTPSGWTLTLDALAAVGAAAVAVIETMSSGTRTSAFIPGIAAVPRVTGTHPGFMLLTAAALTALPLALRRVYPVTAWLVIVAASLVVLPATMLPAVAVGSAVFGGYSAVVHSRYRNLAITVVLAVMIAVAPAFAGLLPRFPGRLTAILAVAPTVVAAGLGIRALRQRVSDSAARLHRVTQEHRAATQRAAAEHEAATRQAVETERARITAELHDVVTHNVSVMVVQAGAARTVLASAPGAAAEALLAVEASGRTALAELRNLLGLLSPPGGPPGDTAAALSPQPGLGELDSLIGRVSAAGLPVELAVRGTPQPLPPGADLAAYRVVQEGLTNVLRHAGQAAASVMVAWGERLVITVSDDSRGLVPGEAGTRRRPGAGDEPGRGLLGLRERLSLYGGELDAGPRPGGGWQVRAVMPVGLAA
jgi:signal transduction histidine kinase